MLDLRPDHPRRAAELVQAVRRPPAQSLRQPARFLSGRQPAEGHPRPRDRGRPRDPRRHAGLQGPGRRRDRVRPEHAPRAQARKGMAILYVSTELEHVLEVADRIAVMYPRPDHGHARSRGGDAPSARRAHGRRRARTPHEGASGSRPGPAHAHRLGGRPGAAGRLGPDRRRSAPIRSKPTARCSARPSSTTAASASTLVKILADPARRPRGGRAAARRAVQRRRRGADLPGRAVRHRRRRSICPSCPARSTSSSACSPAWRAARSGRLFPAISRPITASTRSS